MKKDLRTQQHNKILEGFLTGSRHALSAQLLCIFLSLLMIFTTSGSAFAQVVNAAETDPAQTAAAEVAAPTPTAVSQTAVSTSTVEAGDETALRQALKAESLSIMLTADITLTKELEISGSGITIDLNGKTISGGDNTRLFSMTEGASATIKNGTLKDGKASGDGGAGDVKANATLTLENCSIEGNTATGSGGAFNVARGATVVTTNCTFKSNESGKDGGAVAAEAGSNSTKNALFWVGVVGTAVTVVGLVITVVGFLVKKISENKAKQSPADFDKETAEMQELKQEAIKDYKDMRRVRNILTKECNAKNLKAVDMDKLDFNEIFKGNQADIELAKVVAKDPMGINLMSYGSSATGVGASTVDDNAALSLAVRKEYYSQKYDGHMLDANNREYIIQDGAKVYVPADQLKIPEAKVYSAMNEGYLRAQTSFIDAGKASKVVGGDDWAGKTSQLTDALTEQMNSDMGVFENLQKNAINFSATYKSLMKTAGIGRNLAIGGAITTGVGLASTAVGTSGFTDLSSLEAIKNLFKGDTSGFTSSGSTAQSTGTAAATAVSTPRQASDGGRIVSNNTSYISNKAGANGGALSLGNSGSGGAQSALLVSTGDVYKNNEASNEGGAMDSAGKVILTNAVVENNTAKDGAVNVTTEGSYDTGALTVCGTTTIRDNTTKDSNTEQSNVALDEKATIATENLSMKSSIGVDIDDSVKNNTDTKKVAGDVQIDTTGYEADDTTQALEAAFVSDDTALTTEVYGSTKNGSGDVYMGKSAPTVKTVNSWDEMQQALNEGAKIIEAGSDIKAEAGDTPLSVTSQDTTINLKGHDLSAENQCGVMDISAKNVTVMDGTVSGGNAEKGAGVAVQENASTALKAVTLKDNTATDKGGAVYAQTGSTVSLLGCDVTGNTAGSDGGAVALADFNTKYSAGTGAAVNATGTIFTANEAAGDGGVSDIGHGLSTQQGTPVVTYSACTFTENKAEGNGGVDNNDGAVVHIDSTATKNEAGGNGGVIDKQSDATNQGRTVLSGTTTFTGNTCGGEGGATYSNSETDSTTKTTYQGTVKITDNKKEADGTATDSNVYLPAGAKIDLSGLNEETVAAVIQNYSKAAAAQKAASSTTAASTTAESDQTPAPTAATPTPTPAPADEDLQAAQETAPEATADTDLEQGTEAASTAADETTNTAASAANDASGSVIGVTTEDTKMSTVASVDVATSTYADPGSIVSSDSSEYVVTQKTDKAAGDTVVKTASLQLNQEVSDWTGLQKNVEAQRDSGTTEQRITLTKDIKAQTGDTPIVVTQDNTTIDLGGHTIDGAGFTTAFKIAENVQKCIIFNGIIEGGKSSLAEDEYNGGAIIIGKGASLNIQDVTFSNNSAINKGGALYNRGSLNVSVCSITGNSAGTGGGIDNESGASLRLYYTDIQDNKAIYGNGGGIENAGILQATYATIMGNRAAVAGGGLDSTKEASLALIGGPVIINNTGADGRMDNLYLLKDTKLDARLITSGIVGIKAEDAARPLQITEPTEKDASAYFASDATDSHILGQTSETGSVVYIAAGAEEAKKTQETADTTSAAASASSAEAAQKIKDENALADSLVITCESVTYGETLQPAVVSNTSERAVTYQYAQAGKNAWSTAAPVEPGDYQVKGILAKDDKNAEVQSEAVAFTIAKAQPRITGILSASAITSAQAITDSTITGTADVAGTFSWQNPNIKGIEPGSFAFGVLFTPKDTAHYETLVTSAAVLVTEKAKTVTADIASDGSSLTVTAADGSAVPVSELRFYKLVKNEDAASQWVAVENTGAYPTEDGTYMAVVVQAGDTLAGTISFDKTGNGSPTPDSAVTYTINPAVRVNK